MKKDVKVIKGYADIDMQRIDRAEVDSALEDVLREQTRKMGLQADQMRLSALIRLFPEYADLKLVAFLDAIKGKFRLEYRGALLEEHLIREDTGARVTIGWKIPSLGEVSSYE